MVFYQLWILIPKTLVLTTLLHTCKYLVRIDSSIIYHFNKLTFIFDFLHTIQKLVKKVK